MPFKSVRQLQTCYSKQLSARAKGKETRWDCDEWLKKSPRCLPTTESSSSKQCRTMRKGEKVRSPVYEGSRGGLYFYVDGIKVYVPADAKSYVKKNMKTRRPLGR